MVKHNEINLIKVIIIPKYSSYVVVYLSIIPGSVHDVRNINIRIIASKILQNTYIPDRALSYNRGSAKLRNSMKGKIVRIKPIKQVQRP